MSVEVDLFGRTYELEQAEHFATNDEQVWRRWMHKREDGLEVALVRSVTSGNWNAYVNFEEMEPTVRRFNFWGQEQDEPDAAVKSLQESILSAGMFIGMILRPPAPGA